MSAVNLPSVHHLSLGTRKITTVTQRPPEALADVLPLSCHLWARQALPGAHHTAAQRGRRLLTAAPQGTNSLSPSVTEPQLPFWNRGQPRVQWAEGTQPEPEGSRHPPRPSATTASSRQTAPDRARPLTGSSAQYFRHCQLTRSMTLPRLYHVTEEGGKGAGAWRRSDRCARARPLAPPEAGRGGNVSQRSAAPLWRRGVVQVVPAAALPKPAVSEGSFLCRPECIRCNSCTNRREDTKYTLFTAREVIWTKNHPLLLCGYARSIGTRMLFFEYASDVLVKCSRIPDLSSIFSQLNLCRWSYKCMVAEC